LKRNRIICPEIAVNGQVLHGKSNFFKNYLKKSKVFGNLPGKKAVTLMKNNRFSVLKRVKSI